MGVPERITRRFTSREFSAWNVSDSSCVETLGKGQRDVSSHTGIFQAMSLIAKEKANLAVRQMCRQSPQCLVRDDHY